MSQDQLISLVSLSLALILAVMRLRGELAARRHRIERQLQHQQPPLPPADDIEQLR